MKLVLLRGDGSCLPRVGSARVLGPKSDNQRVGVGEASLNRIVSKDFLSGLMFPVGAMPAWMSWLSLADPLLIDD